MTDSDEVKLLPWPLFGYAPGTYTSRCYGCDRRFENADKGAICCLECAALQAKALIANLQSRPPVVTDEVVRARRRLEAFCRDAWGDAARLDGHSNKAATVGDLRVVLEALASMPAVVSGGQGDE